MQDVNNFDQTEITQTYLVLRGKFLMIFSSIDKDITKTIEFPLYEKDCTKNLDNPD